MAEETWTTTGTAEARLRSAGRYSNSVEILTTEFEFAIEFSQTVPVRTEQGGLTIDKRFVERVVMSPHHAKAFSTMLGRFVAGFEAQFGDVPLPESLQEK